MQYKGLFYKVTTLYMFGRHLFVSRENTNAFTCGFSNALALCTQRYPHEHVKTWKFDYLTPCCKARYGCDDDLGAGILLE